MRSIPSIFLAASSAAVLSWSSSTAAQEPGLGEVTVQASLRELDLQDIPVSVTVLDAETLREAGQQHFQDVLALVPNLNWAGTSSRPRYFQIRGIGEREQYEGAPNSSVGFLIDDIDFSGIGMPATLFDVSQIEVLRGPQGTRYGANALAGLIAIRSADPVMDATSLSVEASAAEFETGSLGLVANAPAERLNSAWRLAVQQYRSDGFRKDVFLGRDDTNDRDELTARLKWRWQPSDSTRVDLTLMHADIDNGYDAWSIDNTWISQADTPGVDTQKATAASVRSTSELANGRTLTVIGAFADSDSVNSFDSDWGNPVFWAPYTYNFFNSSGRERRTGSLELRLASAAPSAPGDVAWLIGAYALNLRENGRDIALGELRDPFFPEGDFLLDEALNHRYRATNSALYGQLDGWLTERWSWSAGLRVEHRGARYRDAGVWNGDQRNSDLDADDTMAGGQLSLSYHLAEGSMLYTSVSRGYKAGGFNLGRIPPERRQFEPEFLWSFEAGIKRSWLDGRIFTDTALFYSHRSDPQVRTDQQLVENDPSSFAFVTENASDGYNYGLESSLLWRVSDRWELGGSLGLLKTRLRGFHSKDMLIQSSEQAHSPEYQAAVHANWRHPMGWMARLDVTALDNFYFDVPALQQSRAYVLTHLKVGFEAQNWSAYLWGRNLFDETYAIRGFFFANEPPDWQDKLYIQRGDPRQIGVTFNYSFR